MDKITVNKPLAGTFGWLRVNGTEVEAPARTEEVSITVRDGEERTVVLEDAAAVRVSAEIGRNGVLRLVQVRRGGETAINDIQAECAEKARFEWYRVVLGGSGTYDNCSVTLRGDGSSFLTEYGYRLSGDQRLDVNCEAIHLGKRTECAINASGVLAERAFKLFRGTIDLRCGCSGAVGNEVEDVLLLDETVRNQTVPVILCSEEDVVGNHGATIGRLDEGLVFYLESRGMAREDILEMMARARIDAVIGKIPDEKTVRALRGSAADGEEDA